MEFQGPHQASPYSNINPPRGNDLKWPKTMMLQTTNREIWGPHLAQFHFGDFGGIGYPLPLRDLQQTLEASCLHHHHRLCLACVAQIEANAPQWRWFSLTLWACPFVGPLLGWLKGNQREDTLVKGSLSKANHALGA